MNNNSRKNTFPIISNICVSTGSFASWEIPATTAGECCCFCCCKTAPVTMMDLRDYNGELGESRFLAYVSSLRDGKRKQECRQCMIMSSCDWTIEFLRLLTYLFPL